MILLELQKIQSGSNLGGDRVVVLFFLSKTFDFIAYSKLGRTPFRDSTQQNTFGFFS